MQMRKGYKRYIIVGSARSGTTITHLCLKGHPNVSAVNDEIKISPLFTQGIATFTVSADSYLTLKEKEVGFLALFDAITTIEADENTIATGLKIATKSFQDVTDLVRCFQTYLKDITIILTVREDLVAQYGSGLRARATGQYHSWRKSQLQNEFVVEISREQFINYAIDSLKILEELRKLKMTHKVVEIIYEKDIQPNTWEVYYNLFKFLELPEIEITWLASEKVAPDPEKYIINYSELKDLLENIKSEPSKFLNPVEIKDEHQVLGGSGNWLKKLKSEGKKINNKLKRIQAIIKE
jgi:LPS sulfotransferase NodH